MSPNARTSLFEGPGSHQQSAAKHGNPQQIRIHREGSPSALMAVPWPIRAASLGLDVERDQLASPSSSNAPSRSGLSNAACDAPLDRPAAFVASQ